MITLSKKSSRWNKRIYYLAIAFLIVSLSISEFLLSLMVVRVVNNEAQPSIIVNHRKKALNRMNRAKERFHKKVSDEKTTLLLSKQRFETDVFCPYCRYNYITPKSSITCGKKIITDWKLNLDSKGIESNSMFREAAILLANDKSVGGACRRCDPKSCSQQDKTYYRIDDVGPYIYSATTHYLHSIPSKHRIPSTALHNLTAYFTDDNNIHPNRKYFFEFNPSIVRIPNSQRVISNATYLASFRVSTCHDCITDANDYIRMMNGPRSSVTHTEYLGLAILDPYLNIIQELVTNAKTSILRFQDPRLFVLNDQLYVGSYHSIRPIWLSPPKGKNRKDIGTLEHVWPDIDISKDRIMNGVTIGKKGFCSKDIKTQKSGKNLNYFIDARNDSILEIKPLGPYEMLNMSDICDVKIKTNASFIHHSKPIPYPSFGTTDELDLSRQNYYDAVYTDDRGSACCVSIQHPDGRQLRLGISHSKTVYRSSNTPRRLQSNQYFSNFYAFEAEPPYNVVAWTGKFCLGFPSDSENENPYTKMKVDTIKMIDVEYSSCPRIHFVSGMTEKVDDTTKIIVAYGVNDCVPRMVVIAKADVLRMLFTPHDKKSVIRSQSI